MSVVPVRENRLTVRAAAVVVAAACALALGACRSPETTTTAGGASSTTGKPAAAGAPTTKAKAASKFAKECMSVASFQYYNHMPESGSAKKDPIANDVAAVQKKLKEIGDTISTAVPDLAAPIQAAQASRPGGTKPDAAAWSAAKTKIVDWTKVNC